VRTTVTLDPDVEQLLHERMAAHGISFKQALNDAVRDSSTPRADYVFETPTFDVALRSEWSEIKETMADEEVEHFLEVTRRSREDR